MRHPKQAMVFLFAVLFLATVSQPASAYLYGSWTTPIITDATGDSLASPNNGGTDIAALYFANSGGSHFFRMDLNGAVTTTDLANYYSIIFNSSNPANITGLSATGVPSGGLVYNSSPLASAFEFSPDKKTLEWQIPQGLLNGTFSLSGVTISFVPSFQFNDTTRTATTPIPSAVWLLGSGLLGLIGLQRRRGRKS